MKKDLKQGILKVKASVGTKDLVITRFFSAPRELVWRAWTEPDFFKRWWGPRGFTAPAAKIDLRVGGEYHSCMRSPEGKDFWSKGVIKEIVPNEKLVMTDSFADEMGNVVPASAYGMDKDWPIEMLITVDLKDVYGKTHLTLTHSGVDKISSKNFKDMEQGWNESLDKLAEELEKEHA